MCQAPLLALVNFGQDFAFEFWQVKINLAFVVFVGAGWPRCVHGICRKEQKRLFVNMVVFFFSKCGTEENSFILDRCISDRNVEHKWKRIM